MSDFRYVGSELDLFAAAHNWKSYWSRKIARFISGEVLEVGAGIGANAPWLQAHRCGRWVCLEPDAQLTAELTRNLSTIDRLLDCEVLCGTLQSLHPEDRFDTILYIDVLEHIESDAAELLLAAARLRPGGRIVVLAPAHAGLFTPFDASIGHFRRYNKSSLRRISPPHLRVESLFYLDSLGIAASAANRLFLRQSIPTPSQIAFWDRRLIPLSRAVDPLLRYTLGKSIVGVWRKAHEAVAPSPSA